MGKTDLGKWMITNGGEYSADATYEQLTMVKYGNSTYITLKTVTGITPTDDKINYQLMAQGFDATALSAVQAEDTQGLCGEKGEIVTAQSLVDALADKVMNTVMAKIGTAALTGGMTDLSSGVNSLYSDLASIGTELRFIKNFNNPNEELKLTQYAYSNYVSIGNTSGYGYATIYGMYDNNNGNAISGQMAITSSGEVLKRSYKNGAWTKWNNVDDNDTNLKRMPLDGTIAFNQFTITTNTSGKYVLNFYKDTVKIASIVSA